MFRIRVFTPPVINEEGWPHAGAELVVGDARRFFLLDLTYWGISAYQQQWREGITRLVGGASSSALMGAYKGPGDAPHFLWALWREDGSVFVQGHTVVPAEADSPFDPSAPYPHVGERIAASEYGLSIPEWRFDVTDLYATGFGIR